MARGDCSFVAGHDNTCSSSYMGYHCGAIVLGNNNSCEPADGANMGICIGNSNGFYQGSGQICIGSNNLMKNTVKTNAIVIGFYNEGQKNCVQIGNYADSSTLPLNNTKFIVGCGASAVRHQNAIECSTGASAWTGNSDPITLIKYNFGLNNATSANKAFVNAITPPQDPDNVTTDDKTLATVGYIQGSYQKSQVAYFSEYDAAVSVPVDGTSIDVETSLGAIPSWANRLIITFRWENELFVKEIHFTKNEGVHLYAVQRAYSTFPETIAYKHLRLEWDYTNKTLTAADYWTYDQDMANAGAIANWDHTLANAPTCKILSAVYSE